VSWHATNAGAENHFARQRTRIVGKWRIVGEGLILVCRSVFAIYNGELSFLKKKWRMFYSSILVGKYILLKTRENSWQKMEPPTSKHTSYIKFKNGGIFSYIKL